MVLAHQEGGGVAGRVHESAVKERDIVEPVAKPVLKNCQRVQEEYVVGEKWEEDSILLREEGVGGVRPL